MDYNVIIHIGEEPFNAHSNILRFRSKYFDEILSVNDIEKKKWKIYNQEIKYRNLKI